MDQRELSCADQDDVSACRKEPHTAHGQRYLPVEDRALAKCAWSWVHNPARLVQYSDDGFGALWLDKNLALLESTGSLFLAMPAISGGNL